MIKLVKDSFKKLVGNAHLDYDQLATILSEVENALNSRPLTYLSEENFEDALTPFHLIFGRNINSKYVVCSDVKDMDGNELTEFSKHVKVVLSHFMSRFYTEYTTALRERHRYQRGITDDDCKLKIGDVV